MDAQLGVNSLQLLIEPELEGNRCPSAACSMQNSALQYTNVAPYKMIPYKIQNDNIYIRHYKGNSGRCNTEAPRVSLFRKRTVNFTGTEGRISLFNLCKCAEPSVQHRQVWTLAAKTR